MNNTSINSYIVRHETVLQDLVNQAEIPAPKLKEAIQYCLFPGGKRLRPLLVYLTGEIIDANIESLDIIAAAIELTHCYSLIQDDLPAMDNDDYRRGRPTCHRAFDEATAILVSDGMQGLAQELLLKKMSHLLSEQQIIDITFELLKASGFSGMISGQSLDLTMLHQTNLNTDQLRYVHQLKTGALFSCCVNMALIAGKSSELYTSMLRRFVDCLGVAFQIQDDYHDRYSSHDISGKNRASDEANQKTTFATLLNQRDLLDLINQHYQTALLALEPFGDKAQNLRRFTQSLYQRTSQDLS
jgi:farnesyl diphosphate synthase